MTPSTIDPRKAGHRHDITGTSGSPWRLPLVFPPVSGSILRGLVAGRLVPSDGLNQFRISEGHARDEFDGRKEFTTREGKWGKNPLSEVSRCIVATCLRPFKYRVSGTWEGMAPPGYRFCSYSERTILSRSHWKTLRSELSASVSGATGPASCDAHIRLFRSSGFVWISVPVRIATTPIDVTISLNLPRATGGIFFQFILRIDRVAFDRRPLHV